MRSEKSGTYLEDDDKGMTGFLRRWWRRWQVILSHTFQIKGLRWTQKLEGTFYVYTFNVTSMLLNNVLFIHVSIEMYIMTIN